MTDIWYSAMDNIGSETINSYREALPVAMQEEIARFRQEKDRRSRILARTMINLYLEQTEQARTPLAFELDEFKKPHLPNGPCFNISHSGNYVMVGFGSYPVGVDIEEKRTIDWELITSHFHEAERAYIALHENKEDAFYRVWARKEAYLKAIGVGILKGLNTVNALEEVLADEQGGWRLYDADIAPGYASAVCVPINISENTIQYKNINPLLTKSKC